MMYWISEKSGETLTMNQLQHCLMRNFGGKTDVNKTVELFLRKVRADLLQTKPSTSDIEIQVSYFSYLFYLYVHFILLFFRVMIVLCMD